MNKDCIIDVANILGKDADEVLDISNELEKELVDAIDPSKGTTIYKAIDDLTRKKKIQAALKEKNALLNIKARVDFIEKATKVVALNAKNNITYFDVLEAELVGTNRNIKGARGSIYNQSQSIRQKYLGNILYQLDEAGLTKLATSNKISSRDLAKELYNFNGKDVLDDLNFESIARKNNTKFDIYDGFEARSKSGNREAFALAKIIAKTQHELVTRANSAGAYIKTMDNYIIKQSHDPNVLHKTGYDEWAKTIAPLLDIKRTFDLEVGDTNGISKALIAVYNNIVFGKAESEAISNSGVAGKLSKSRVLHFIDDSKFVTYNNKYGRKNMIDSVLSLVNDMSNDIALMERLGPNPEESFKRILNDIQSAQTKIVNKLDPKSKAAKKLNKQLKGGLSKYKLNGYFNEVAGANDIPVIEGFGKFLSGARRWNNITLLGGAGISALGDVATIPMETSYQGMGSIVPFMKALKVPLIEPLRDIFRSKTKFQQKQIAKLIGVGMEGFNSTTIDRFAIDAGYSYGTATDWLQKQLFKFNGLNWVTNNYKSAFALMNSSWLAEHSNLKFSELDNRMNSTLNKFNIGEHEWDLIRKTSYKADDGNMYITPDKIKHLEAADVFDYLKKNGYTKDMSTAYKAIEKTKETLETNVRGYFVDRADFASVTPDAKTRTLLTMGTQRGTNIGEAVRCVAQFKSFSVAMLQKVWGREIYGRYGGANAIKRMTVSSALLMGTGTIVAAMKEITRGEVPKIFNDDFWDDDYAVGKLAWGGAMQSGGAGILGDVFYAVGGSTRYGQSPIETLGGPTVGIGGDITRTVGLGLSATATAALGDAPPSTRAANSSLKLIRYHAIPFGSYPGFRMALDSGYYSMMDAINPGYVRRLKNRREDESREFYIGPLAD